MQLAYKSIAVAEVSIANNYANKCIKLLLGTPRMPYLAGVPRNPDTRPGRVA